MLKGRLILRRRVLLRYIFMYLSSCYAPVDKDTDLKSVGLDHSRFFQYIIFVLCKKLTNNPKTPGGILKISSNNIYFGVQDLKLKWENIQEKNAAHNEAYDGNDYLLGIKYYSATHCWPSL